MKNIFLVFTFVFVWGSVLSQDIAREPLTKSRSVQVEQYSDKKMFWEQWFDRVEKEEQRSIGDSEIPASNLYSDAEFISESSSGLQAGGMTEEGIRQIVKTEEPTKNKQSFLTRTWNRLTGKKKSPETASTRVITDTVNETSFSSDENVVQPMPESRINIPGVSVPTLPMDLTVSETAEPEFDRMTDDRSDIVSDSDGDTFTDNIDLCPNTPGRANGCPDFAAFTVPSAQKDITLRRLNQTDYQYEEFDQIRIGDTFQLQVVDPLTERVIMTSEPYRVEK